jgi:3-oxoacyl-[acyl-carrier protein] reductase
MNRLKNKIMLITGASSGIGQATAIAAAAEGATVIVHYNTNESGGKETLARIKSAGGNGILLQRDLSRSVQVTKMFDHILAEFKRLDILVNNHGAIIKRAPIETITDDEFLKIIEVNLHSVFYTCRAAIKPMKEQKSGKIINVTSVAARNGGGKGAGVYAAAKGGVLTFTKALANELGSYGIQANCVAPGFVDTPFHSGNIQDVRNSFAERSPLKRVGLPEDIVPAILFLASDESKFITGATIDVNGGIYMI